MIKFGFHATAALYKGQEILSRWVLNLSWEGPEYLATNTGAGSRRVGSMAGELDRAPLVHAPGEAGIQHALSAEEVE